MYKSGKNSWQEPSYAAPPTTPSSASLFFLNEEYLRKDTHVVSSATFSTSQARVTSDLKSSRQTSPQWIAESMGIRISKACTSAANGGASGEISPLNLMKVGVKNSSRTRSPLRFWATLIAFPQMVGSLRFFTTSP